MALLNTDITNVDPTNTFDVIPAGDYLVTITESEFRDTKDLSGKYLNLKLEIQGGQYQGRKLFDRLNLINRNQKAVEIATRTLSQIGHAVGVLQIQDSEVLHHKPMFAIVIVKKDPARGPQNEVKGYKKAQMQQTSAFQAPIAQHSAPQPQQTPAFPPPAANAVPPWLSGKAA